MENNQLRSRLVGWKMVTDQQVRTAVSATAGTSTSWLDYLLMSRQLDEDAVARYAGDAMRAPPCDLVLLAQVPREILDLLPRDLALEHRMVPVSIEPDGDLAVGIVDPFDDAAIQEVEFFVGRRLLRQVALATPLAWALTTYYGAHCALWPRPVAVARPAHRLARGSVPPPFADGPWLGRGA